MAKARIQDPSTALLAKCGERFSMTGDSEAREKATATARTTATADPLRG
jgi:hypothetical protein